MRTRGTSSASQAGFMLVELLTVTLILGILAAIAVPTFWTLRGRGYQATVQSDLRNSAVAMEVWQSLAGESRYPREGEINLPLTEPGVTVTIALPVAADGGGPFCLEGSHASLTDGAVVATYDQRAGGLTANDSC
jgi:type IV pilus assembly protein PilA